MLHFPNFKLFLPIYLMFPIFFSFCLFLLSIVSIYLARIVHHTHTYTHTHTNCAIPSYVVWFVNVFDCVWLRSPCSNKKKLPPTISNHRLFPPHHLSRIIIEMCSELPICPPLNNDQMPASWWTPKCCDKSLLVGTYKHGCENYRPIRNDPVLCFFGHLGPDSDPTGGCSSVM